MKDTQFRCSSGRVHDTLAAAQEDLYGVEGLEDVLAVARMHRQKGGSVTAFLKMVAGNGGGLHYWGGYVALKDAKGKPVKDAGMWKEQVTGGGGITLLAFIHEERRSLPA
jgi:hypothetical protein